MTPADLPDGLRYYCAAMLIVMAFGALIGLESALLDRRWLSGFGGLVAWVVLVLSADHWLRADLPGVIWCVVQMKAAA